MKVRQFFTLAVLTAVEAIRQPIYLLLSTTCVLLIGLVPIILMHHFGEDGKLARDSGLALQFVFGLFIAGYTASSCLDREIRSGTASAVLSKPISREVFFLSKFAGTLSVIVMFSICSGIATLLSERVSQKFVASSEMVGFITDSQTGWMLISAPFVAYLVAGLLNYFKRKSFESSAFVILMFMLITVLIVSGFFNRAGTWAPYDLRIHTGVISVSVLVMLALMVISAIAITLSARLSIVPTLTICSAVFFLGLMSDYFFGAKAQSSNFFMMIYWLIPNWQDFWTVDALTNGGHIPWRYVGHAAFYTGAYTAGILCIGLLSFCRKEMR